MLGAIRKLFGGGGGAARPESVLDRVSPELRAQAVAKLEELAATPTIQAMSTGSAGTGWDGSGYRTERNVRTGATGRNTQNKPARSVLTAKVQGNLRAKCRSAIRNNTVVRGFARRLCEHVVGTGFTFQCRSGDKAWDREQSRKLNLWAREEVKLWRIAQWVIRAWLTDGDALVLKVRGADGACRLQCIEADLLVTPDPTGAKPLGCDDGTLVVLPNGNTITAGVEATPGGEVVAYHIAEWGDEQKLRAEASATGKVVAGGAAVGAPWGLGTVRRVPAEMVMFLSPETFGNPGQHRGEPGLQAILPMVELLFKYMEDVLIAADMATLFSLIIESANPALAKQTDEATLGAAVGMAVQVAAGTPAEVALEGGVMRYIGMGEKVVQVDPKFPQMNVDAFIKVTIQIAGCELGLPPMMGFFEMGGLTASNGKVTLAMAYRGFETPQEVQVVDLYLPSGRFKLGTDIARGVIPLPRVTDPLAWRNIQVSTTYAPVIDMKSEFEGWDYGIQKNLTTHDEACRQLGSGSGDEVAEERKREIERDQDLGITPVLLPGAKAPDGSSGGKGGAHASGGSGSDPAAEPSGETDADPADGPVAKEPAAKPNASSAAAGDVNAGKTAFLVGDKTAAIDIAKQTKAGTITREAGLAVLTDLVGLDEATASRIATEADPVTTQTTPASDGDSKTGGGA